MLTDCGRSDCRYEDVYREIGHFATTCTEDSTCSNRELPIVFILDFSMFVHAAHRTSMLLFDQPAIYAINNSVLITCLYSSNLCTIFNKLAK